MHTREPLVPEPSALIELAIQKLKSLKSTSIDQIPSEMVKAGGKTIRPNIHKIINSIWNKEELSEDWKESITLPMYNKDDKTDGSNYTGISLLSTTYVNKILLSSLTPYAGKIIGDHQCGFRRKTTSQLLIKYSAFVKYLRKNGNTMKQCISCL